MTTRSHRHPHQRGWPLSRVRPGRGATGRPAPLRLFRPGLLLTAGGLVVLRFGIVAAVGAVSPAMGATSPARPMAQLVETGAAGTCYSTLLGVGGTSRGGHYPPHVQRGCGINMLNGRPGQQPGGTPLRTTVTIRSMGRGRPGHVALSAGECTAASVAGSRPADSLRESGVSRVGRADGIAGFCREVEITIANTTPGAADKCVYPTLRTACPALSSRYTLATLSGKTFGAWPLSVLRKGRATWYVVTDQLNAQAGPAYQDLTASLPFTWSTSP